MPRIDVIFYAEAGAVSALEWLRAQPAKVQDKFEWMIDQLEERGHELRRPLAAPLRDGIYELRVRQQRVNYRILYFFHGNTAAVLAAGCVKEKEVPDVDIDRAATRRNRFLQDPARHTHQRTS